MAVTQPKQKCHFEWKGILLQLMEEKDCLYYIILTLASLMSGPGTDLRKISETNEQLHCGKVLLPKVDFCGLNFFIIREPN